MDLDERVDGSSAGGFGPAAPSRRYRIALRLAAVGIVGVLGVHLAALFLTVAPRNLVTERHGGLIRAWVNPEFEQRWELFAPDPYQANFALQARAMAAGAGDPGHVSDWVTVSSPDYNAIRHNPAPSHLWQYEARGAAEFYGKWHDGADRPVGLLGRLSASYLCRLIMKRVDPAEFGGPVTRIQIRFEYRPIPAPAWSSQAIDASPTYRVLPWWAPSCGALTTQDEG
jgi:hypothetical protein